MLNVSIQMVNIKYNKTTLIYFHKVNMMYRSLFEFSQSNKSQLI